LCPPKCLCRIRPSFVRSKTAPHASSSRTRSGASFACNSAMRHWFTYCPPRIVSAKCTFQLSRSSTLASAAAIPPSAITVCALPKSDLQTSPTDTPAADASMAARNPAPPAPITRTSCSYVSYSGMAMVERVKRVATLQRRPFQSCNILTQSWRRYKRRKSFRVFSSSFNGQLGFEEIHLFADVVSKSPANVVGVRLQADNPLSKSWVKFRPFLPKQLDHFR